MPFFSLLGKDKKIVNLAFSIEFFACLNLQKPFVAFSNVLLGLPFVFGVLCFGNKSEKPEMDKAMVGNFGPREMNGPWFSEAGNVKISLP